ncbi:MAG: UbiD family decarboxylase [Thermoplasmata archaeon]
MSSFRDFLNRLDRENRLIRIKKEVSPDYEAASILSELDGRPVLFERVKGSSMPVAGGICSSRELIAESLGIKKEQLLMTLANAIRNRKEPEVITGGECQEVVEKNADLTKLPILLHVPGDGGKYISSAISVIKDPDLGRNVSFHRLMLLGKDKFVARIVENRGTDTALKKSGGELDIAICIGNSNAVLLAASTSLAPGEDEFSMANALDKVQLVKCKTVDLEVPRDCEIVLEGKITKEKAPEGPFLDITGTQDKVREQPVIEIKCITHRKNPIYQALLPGKWEHRLLMGMPKEPTIYNEVNKVCRCRNVLITPGGCSWLHAVVQIKKENPDDGRKAIAAAFKGHGSLKHCVVVDDDIDIYDMNDVEWAIATRFQADKNLVIMPNMPGSSLDPSGDLSEGKKAMTCKAGIDATIPFDKKDKKFKRGEYAEIDVKRYL